MKDSVIFGTGNSRYLKSVEDFKTLYPTYDDFAAALVAGTLPVDFNGINTAGFQRVGDALGKATLLKDATAALYGFDNTAVPDDVFKKLYGYPVFSLVSSGETFVLSLNDLESGTYDIYVDDVRDSGYEDYVTLMCINRVSFPATFNSVGLNNPGSGWTSENGTSPGTSSEGISLHISGKSSPAKLRIFKYGRAPFDSIAVAYFSFAENGASFCVARMPIKTGDDNYKYGLSFNLDSGSKVHVYKVMR